MAESNCEVIWQVDWPPAATPLELAANEVHVWRVSLDGLPESDDSLMALLPAAERERAGRFRFASDRDRFVRSHAALRTILGTYLHAAPEALVFREGAHGKPFIDCPAGAVPIRFNLSHSDSLALVAVALGREVGVDLERVRPVSDMAGIAARYFSPFEQQALERVSPEKRLHAFFATWVLKEAYLKACGDGLVRRLADFDVTIGDDEPPRLLSVSERPGDVTRWTLWHLKPCNRFVAALAVEGAALAGGSIALRQAIL